MTIDMEILQIANIKIEITKKDIKNVHLSVHPPNGRVTIAAPLRMDLDIIRAYAISKLGWIKKQQQLFNNQERETPREFLNRESHYFKGQRYLLKVIEEDSPPKVVLNHSTIELYTRPDTSPEKKESILEEWYREQLKQVIPSTIEKWEIKMGVKVNAFGVKKMKTKWGSCNREEKRIWLNLELAKKPPECLEYIIVHEMIHLLERNHNGRFVSLMDECMPKWRYYKEELNHLPVKHEDWRY